MSVKTLSPQQALELLNNNKAIMIDVREADEVANDFIANSIHIPLGKIHIDNLPDHDDKIIIMQCRSGIRSATACEIIQAQSVDVDVYNLEGGIIEWRRFYSR